MSVTVEETMPEITSTRLPTQNRQDHCVRDLVRHIRWIFHIILIVFICGCQMTPLREINYRGQLPPVIRVGMSHVLEFASALSTETELTITYISQPTGNPTLDAHMFVEMKPSNGEKIITVVDFDERSNSFRIQLYGDIESPTAKAIVHKAEELFAKRYPSSKLTPFTRYNTILGP